MPNPSETAGVHQEAEVNRRRQFALTRHCRLSVETMHPDFSRRLASGLTVVLTVNSGYE